MCLSDYGGKVNGGGGNPGIIAVSQIQTTLRASASPSFHLLLMQASPVQVERLQSLYKLTICIL